MSNYILRTSAQAYMKAPEEEQPSSACGSACGAGEKEEETPSACGSACGAGDKEEETPSACGAVDK